VSIPLRIIDPPLDFDWWTAKPGDMWPCPTAGEMHAVEGRAPCWIIRLPDRAWVWHTNERATDAGYWTITGEPPNITVTPSINVGPEIWHGFITNGYLTP
jgi:hypothetical protein